MPEKERILRIAINMNLKENFTPEQAVVAMKEEIESAGLLKVAIIDFMPTREDVAAAVENGNYNVLICQDQIGDEPVGVGTLREWKKKNPSLSIYLLMSAKNYLGSRKDGEPEKGSKPLYLFNKVPYYDGIYFLSQKRNKGLSTGEMITKLYLNPRKREEAYEYYGIEEIKNRVSQKAKCEGAESADDIPVKDVTAGMENITPTPENSKQPGTVIPAPNSPVRIIRNPLVEEEDLEESDFEAEEEARQKIEALSAIHSDAPGKDIVSLSQRHSPTVEGLTQHQREKMRVADDITNERIMKVFGSHEEREDVCGSSCCVEESMVEKAHVGNEAKREGISASENKPKYIQESLYDEKSFLATAPVEEYVPFEVTVKAVISKTLLYVVVNRVIDVERIKEFRILLMDDSTPGYFTASGKYESKTITVAAYVNSVLGPTNAILEIPTMEIAKLSAGYFEGREFKAMILRM